MRPVGIVVDPPCFDDATRHRQPPEHMFVQAFVAEAAVEAFDEGVLLWLAWRDVVPLDAAFLLPA
jgi:hypothetical protein